MRWIKTRATDSAFDLNLAPFLDIVVSVVSLLLLASTFLDVKMIETPIPQAVSQVIEKLEKKNKVEITLKLSKKAGFTFLIEENGKQFTENVSLNAGNMDFNALQERAALLKRKYPTVFDLSLSPEKDLALEDIVKALDRVRRFGNKETVEVQDPDSGSKVTTDLMFPNIVFANVIKEK